MLDLSLNIPKRTKGRLKSREVCHYSIWVAARSEQHMALHSLFWTAMYGNSTSTNTTCRTAVLFKTGNLLSFEMIMITFTKDCFGQWCMVACCTTVYFFNSLRWGFIGMTFSDIWTAHNNRGLNNKNAMLQQASIHCCPKYPDVDLGDGNKWESPTWCWIDQTAPQSSV